MAGYNFTYLIYAKFEKPEDGVFLKQLTKEFLKKLDEDLRQWIGVDYQVQKGLASFSLRSLSSLDYDTMYETFDNFEDYLKFKQAHFVGAIHSFDRTTDDYQNYDDVMYTEFVPTSEEEKNKLKQLLIKKGTLYVTGDCVLALRNGHIDELDDDAANDWIDQFQEFEEGIYVEDYNYPYLKRLEKAAEAVYQQIEEVLTSAFANEINYRGDIIALEPYTMNELFTEVWEKHSEVLTDLLDQLVAMQEKYDTGIITIEDRKEDLLQFYEQQDLRIYRQDWKLCPKKKLKLCMRRRLSRFKWAKYTFQLFMNLLKNLSLIDRRGSLILFKY